MKKVKFLFILILSIILYGFSRPSFFIIDGLSTPWSYLSPVFELISLILFIWLIKNGKTWKERLFSSFIYTFSCQSLLYYAGILFTIKRLLPTEPLYQHLINIFLIGYNHFHLILWGTVLIPWALKKKYRWLFISLMMVVWEYHIPTIIVISVGQTWIEYAPHLKLATFFGFPIFGLFQYFTSGIFFFRHGKLITPILFILFVLLNLNFSEGLTSKNKIAITHMSLEPRGVLARDFGSEKMRELYLKEIQKGIPPHWDIDFWLAPESAWPLLVTTDEDIQYVSRYIFQGKLPPRDFAIGITRLVDKNDYLHVKNSLLFFNPQGEHSLYDKIKLMPFSETNFMGLSDEFIADILGKKDFNIPGSDYPVYQVGNGPRFISTICSEVSHLGFVQHYMSKAKENPDFIINGANDKWFTPSNIPLLHFIMNRWMAVSFEKPVVRSTIGGISGFITYNGVVTTMTSSDQTEVLMDNLIYKKDRTSEKNVYARLGLIPLFLLSGLLVIIFFWSEKRK